MSLASLFSPGTYEKVQDNKAAIAASLAPDSPLYQSANMHLGQSGSAGNQAILDAARLGGTQFSPDTAAMDASSSKLGAIGSLYGNMFRDGGLAEAAQTVAGNSDIASLSQGGQVGVRNQIANSRQIMGQTSGVGTAERGQAGAAENQNDFQRTQMALAKLTMQTQATHAGYLTQMQAQAIQNALSNQQVSNDLNVNQAAANAQTQNGQISQGVSNTNWAAGMQIGQGILGAGAAMGAGYLNDYTTQPSYPALNEAINRATSLQLATPGSIGQPSSNALANIYTPGALQLTYPSDASAWGK